MKTNNILLKWYEYLFETKMDINNCLKCFECNKKMPEKIFKKNSICYSHILSKKKYPQYIGKNWNVKIVCPDCHYLYTILPSKAVNQYKEYLKLKEIYL